MTTAENSSLDLGTLGVAMVTPFTEDASAVDHDALRVLTEHLLDIGHDLLVVNGTTGESPTTSDEEKLAILRTVKETVGDRAQVMAGIGSNSTAHTAALARATAATGCADSLLVVTPYYNKPSQGGVKAHFRAVAEASDLPILLYDIPGRAGIPITPETAIELSAIPTIRGIKDARGDLHDGSDLMRITKLEIYSGEDALNLPWLSVGASGIISVCSHVTGRLDRMQIDAAHRGDLITAQRIHSSRIPFVNALMNQVPGAVAVKHAMEHFGILPHATVRLPLTPADPQQIARITASSSALAGIVKQFERGDKK
ncbi:4-hydroxy-tetrahydrodipicolinate synthase [Helcobacillus massiliensis]|uniref:4-hydroxy-tetrahydrodipicolinate synthase n=1 Tax=Helcobacillus massiliensis TaxID=521392 RepID=A0A839QP94_9MICO|nr:4-hydroxy-tetrahydrodipicolinate synthase [Helcobacillus massiliensis]MBB3021802.1 4-hydroxy-tetrahydrodipicolinate synthase [Helcobacillus massiliensis]